MRFFSGEGWAVEFLTLSLSPAVAGPQCPDRGTGKLVAQGSRGNWPSRARNPRLGPRLPQQAKPLQNVASFRVRVCSTVVRTDGLLM